MFDDIKAMGIELSPTEEEAIQRQIKEITNNSTVADLNNEYYLKGMSRILVGAMSFYIDTKFPSPLKEYMLYVWVKYTFLALIHLKNSKGFSLSCDVSDKCADEFKDAEEIFGAVFKTKVTLAQESSPASEQEGEQNERREESDRREA